MSPCNALPVDKKKECIILHTDEFIMLLTNDKTMVSVFIGIL